MSRKLDNNSGKPEIHAVERLAVLAGDGADDRGQGAGLSGFEDRDHRDDGDEDSGEQLRNFEDRMPIKFVGGAVFPVGELPRHPGDQQ